MANQPKKYKKFVASAATATLVASAIVPVASAATPSDIAGNDHEQNIKDLLELGYVSGKADGSFAPNEAVTRGQVVLMLGKWAEAQGIEVPADYLEKEYFTDYPSYLTDDNKKYYALVKAAGIFEGYADGSLKPGQNISRVQMAVVLNSAYEAVTGKSLVELAGDTSDVVVNDIDAVYADYQPAVLAMKKLGITAVSNYNPSGTVTRGQFASFLNATIKAEAPAAGDLVATATGVKELTLEFDSSVDTEKAKITVKKGSTAVVVSDVEWNIDDNKAVLTLGSKLVDGTYTVTVDGVAEEALTAEVTTKAEVASSIQISPYLVLAREEDQVGTLDTAAVKFAVLNQYGEDITTTLPSGNFDVKMKSVEEDFQLNLPEKRVDVVLDEDTDEGDTGTITIEYEDENKDIELSATQEITVSEEIVVDTTEIHGIYSASGKELTSSNLKKSKDRAIDEFYLKLKAFNQYGAEIENVDDLKATLKDVSIDVSEDELFDFPKLDDVVDTDVLFQTIDGEKYILVPLDLSGYEDNTYGENTVTVESDTNKETTATFTVEESDAIVDVQLGTPDKTITGGAEVKIPVNAYNQAGELVVDAGELEDLTEGTNPDLTIDIDGDPDYKFTEENGQVYLVFTADVDPDNESYELEISVEFDNDVYDSEYEYVFNVEPKSEANAITLYDEDTYFFANGTTQPTIDIDFGDFEIEDQFGNEYDGSEYVIKVKDDELPSNVTAVTAENDIAFVIDQGKSATVDFELYKVEGSEEQKVDEYSVTFRTVDHDQFDSYTVKEFDSIYSDNDNDQNGAYAREIEVYGVLGNGVEVKLPASEYSISTSGALKTYFDESTPGEEVYKLFGKEDKVDDLSSDDLPSTAEGSYTAVINNDKGTEVKSSTITLSADAPEAAEVAFVDSDDDVLTTIEVEADGDDSINLTSLFANLDDSDDFYIVDSYGLEDWFRVNDDSDADAIHDTAVDAGVVQWVTATNETSDIKLTFSDFDTDLFRVTGNGSNEATLLVKDAAEDSFEAGESFKVKVTIDGVSTTVTVFVR